MICGLKEPPYFPLSYFHLTPYRVTSVLVLFLEPMAIASIVFPISLFLFHLSLLKHISLVSITKRLWPILF